MKKEISVLCNLYLEVDDDTDVESALDSVLMHIDPDMGINIHKYELREKD